MFLDDITKKNTDTMLFCCDNPQGTKTDSATETKLRAVQLSKDWGNALTQISSKGSGLEKDIDEEEMSSPSINSFYLDFMCCVRKATSSRKEKANFEVDEDDENDHGPPTFSIADARKMEQAVTRGPWEHSYYY